MANPLNGDWEPLKRLGRYLLAKPRVVHMFRWQESPMFISAFGDSNWAGCHRTRRSTSGACFMHGAHLLKAYFKTQANMALSSGEAEFYSMVHATSEALGLKAMMPDYDDIKDAWLYVDASAAIGVAQRTGLGKIRHLDTGSLWLQQAVKEKKIGILKVKGTENPSDLMTKFTDANTLDKLSGLMGILTRGGRAEAAPQVVGRKSGGQVDAMDLDLVGAVIDEGDGEQTPDHGTTAKAAEDSAARCSAAMAFSPRLLSPARSLPLADVAVAGRVQTELACTVHSLGYDGSVRKCTNPKHKAITIADTWRREEMATRRASRTRQQQRRRVRKLMRKHMRNNIHVMIKISKSWKAKSRRQEEGQVRSAIIAGSDDNPERHRSAEHEPNFETDESGSTKTEMKLGKHDQPRDWHFLLGQCISALSTISSHQRSYESTPPYEDLCVPLEGGFDDQLSAFLSDHRVKFISISCRGEVCRYALPTHLFFRINSFVFHIACCIDALTLNERTAEQAQVKKPTVGFFTTQRERA